MSVFNTVFAIVSIFTLVACGEEDSGPDPVEPGIVDDNTPHPQPDPPADDLRTLCARMKADGPMDMPTGMSEDDLRAECVQAGLIEPDPPAGLTYESSCEDILADHDWSWASEAIGTRYLCGQNECFFEIEMLEGVGCAARCWPAFSEYLLDMNHMNGITFQYTDDIGTFICSPM